MTPEEIIKGNRTLAFFDDNEIVENWDLTKDCHVEKLRYHKSYDWLHPVWVKFRDLDIWKLQSYQKLDFWNLYQRIAYALLYKTVLDAFKILVEAIEWYNSIKGKENGNN